MADANSDSDRPRGSRGSVRAVMGAGHTRIVLSGEVDASLNADLTDAVAAAEAAAVPTQVDTRGVTFIDSSGVALLARLAARVPGRLVVLDPPGVLTFLLDVTRIGEVVDVVRTRRGSGRETSDGAGPDVERSGDPGGTESSDGLGSTDTPDDPDDEPPDVVA